MGSHCNWDGTLSPDEFQVASRALSERWKEINPTHPQLSWNPSPTPPSSILTSKLDGCLSLESIYRFGVNKEYDTEEKHHHGKDSDDNATLFQDDNLHTHIYNFHILYSFSYRVPVLYFRGYQCDGQPLELSHIEKDLPLYSLKILRESKWTYITQEEHPFLHRPWYMLHPCGTSEWMKLLLSGVEKEGADIGKYLTSWLSVVGQAVGLRIPLEMQSISPQFNSASLPT